MSRALIKFERKSFAIAALLGLSLLSTLSCRASVHGTVSNSATHRPIGGVQLAAVNFGFSPPIEVASTVSAADGSYTLEFRSGSFPVFASALGYADYSNFFAPSGTFNISLDPVAAIAGTVFDPDSHPVRYDVQVLDAATGAFVTDAQGDSNGKFAVNNIAPGLYMLCVITNFDEYQDTCYHDQPIGADGVPHGTPVNVASAKVLTGLDIHLQTGATISGTLSHRAFLGPIYGYMRFMLYTPAGALVTSLDTLTDPGTGAYRIVGLAPGSYYVVAGEPFGFSSGYYPHVYGGADCEVTDPLALPVCSFAGVTPLDVPAQGLTDIDFDLSDGGSVNGRVVDVATGLGIPGVRVNACVPSNYYPSAGAVTDASGFYIITHVLQHFVVGTEASGYIDKVWPDTIYDASGKCISNDPQSLLALPTPTASLNGIDFSLKQGSHVAGKVSGNQGIGAHVVFVRSDGDGVTFAEDVAVNPDGSFATENLTTTGYYTALAYLDDGLTCTLYGGGPCGSAWQPSNPLSANFTNSPEFLVAPGVVILNLDFQMIFDHVFGNSFE